MFTIRSAVLEDAPTLATIQVGSYRSAYAGLFPPSYLDHFTLEEQEQDWREILSSETKDVLFVAAAQNLAVGYVLVRPQVEEFPGYQAEIVALHVSQPYQRQGAGRKLLSHAARHLAGGGAGAAMLWNP